MAHWFARVYCGNCRTDYLVAFYCNGRDLCPSCTTRRIAEASVRLVDQVLPQVQHRQWVPKRVRWHLRHRPEVISDLLTTILLRAVETTLRQRSPSAPPGRPLWRCGVRPPVRQLAQQPNHPLQQLGAAR
jgi:hypothetical protein